MHYSTQAFLICVAWSSLLCHGNAAKTPPPSQVLSHFARTVGSVLNPTFANEVQSRPNRSAVQKESVTTVRRQVDTRPISQEETESPEHDGAQLNSQRPNVGVNGLQFPNQAFPGIQYERTLQYRYPGFGQQVSQSFFPGAAGAGFSNQLLSNGLPVDPRFFQSQIAGNQALAPIQSEIPKPLNSNIHVNANNNLKESGNSNSNTIQSLGPNSDSKSSAQNRPFDTADFSSGLAGGPGGQGAIGGGGLDPTGGNLRVDNRFAGFDYERVRQNYYNDPGVNQQRYYSSFNEIPFNGGAGSPYRGGSQLGDGYSGLDFNGGSPGRPGGPSSGIRGTGGFGGDAYYGNFYQGPYNNLNYNSLPGGGIGAGGGSGGGGEFADNFDRSNFRSQQFGGLTYPANFAGGYYPGGGGGIGGGGEGGGGGGFGRGFEGAGSSVRTATTKDSSAETAASEENRNVEFEDRDDRSKGDDGVDEEKVRFVELEMKHASKDNKKRSDKT